MPPEFMVLLKYVVYLILFLLPIVDLVGAARKKAAQSASDGPVRLKPREIFSAVTMELGFCVGAIASVTLAGREHAGLVACCLAGAFLLGTTAGCVVSHYLVRRP